MLLFQYDDKCNSEEVLLICKQSKMVCECEAQNCEDMIYFSPKLVYMKLSTSVTKVFISISIFNQEATLSVSTNKLSQTVTHLVTQIEWNQLLPKSLLLIPKIPKALQWLRALEDWSPQSCWFLVSTTSDGELSIISRFAKMFNLIYQLWNWLKSKVGKMIECWRWNEGKTAQIEK